MLDLKWLEHTQKNTNSTKLTEALIQLDRKKFPVH